MIYDFAVVGAGPAGAAFAGAMARVGASVLLIDAGQRRGTLGEVLDPEVRGPLLDLDALDGFLEAGFAPVPTKSVVWGDHDIRQVAGILNPHGEGWAVNRQHFDHLMKAHAQHCGAVRIVGHCRNAARCHSAWSLAIGGKEVKADLVIQAQGRGATLLGHASRSTRPGDDAFAVVASLQAQQDGGFVIERAEYGWWYALHPPGDCAVVSCVLPRSLMRSIAPQVREWWPTALAGTRLLRPYAGTSPDEIHVMPAHGSIREDICGDRWCCIGDAAANYDPMTGKGVAVSLAKGIALARLLGAHGPEQAFAMYAEAEHMTFEQYTREREKLLVSPVHAFSEG